MINLTSIPSTLAGQKITVLGARRSGIYAALLARSKGAQVLLSDIEPLTIDDRLALALAVAGVKIETGGHSPAAQDCDLAVLSPGIPNNAPILQSLAEKRVPVIAEVELAYWFCPTADIIAVTGSNGKTTTTTLIQALFKGTAYEPYCGGNIGTAFSQLILEAEKSSHPRKIFILELSSFQLEKIVHFRPKVSVILNITPDHMDRYEHSMELYLSAKLRITRNQQKNDYYVYNDDDALLLSHLPQNCTLIPAGLYSSSAKRFLVDPQRIFLDTNQTIIERERLAILGEHNLYNILAALNTAWLFGLDVTHLTQTLTDFRPIEHRLEYVATIKGVEYYNDSKATNTDAVNYALRSFQKPIVLILGGKDKDSDFSLLIPEIKRHVREVILIGKAASKIKAALAGVVRLHEAGYSMPKALEIARAIGQVGDVVLLSPACASFDMFDNYEHRGRIFKEIVMHLAQETGNAG